MNASRIQFNEEEHIEGLKPDGIDSEKTARQVLFFVVCRQMTPSKGTVANRHWLNSMPVDQVEVVRMEEKSFGWIRFRTLKFPHIS